MHERENKMLRTWAHKNVNGSMASPSFLTMNNWYFSVKHRLHCFVMFMYAFALARIIHFNMKFSCFHFSCLRWFLSSVSLFSLLMFERHLVVSPSCFKFRWCYSYISLSSITRLNSCLVNNFFCQPSTLWRALILISTVACLLSLVLWQSCVFL